MIYKAIEKVEYSNDGIHVTHSFRVGDTIDSESVPLRLIEVFTNETPRPYIIPEGTEPPPPEPKLSEKDIVEEMEYIEKCYQSVSKVEEKEEIGNGKGEPEYPGMDKLTDKENAVLSLTYRQFSEGEITEKLGIKLSSLKSYYSKIFKKLKVKTIGGALGKVDEQIKSKEKSAE